MSLARTALRFAVVEALNADPVIDGMCLGRIFDSRIGDIASGEPAPVITIYTEDDSGQAYSANNGGPPFDETCELLIEIAVRSVVPGSAPDETSYFIPESDRQLEATIDLLEQRVVDTIGVGDTPQAAIIRTVTRRITAYKSMRFVSEETSIKLAIRMLHLTTHLKAYEPDGPLDAPTGPFASLPDPLRTVCESLPVGSSSLETCTILASKISAPVAAGRFAGIDITAAPRPAIDPASPPTEQDPIPEMFITADTDPSS